MDRETFLRKCRPRLDREWSWCPESLEVAQANRKCPSCGQEFGTAGRLPLHLTRSIGAGVYLIDTGPYQGYDGARCFKFGLAVDMLPRLLQHLNNHERCEVLHCLRCPPGYFLVNAVECVLGYQLETRGVTSVGGTWEYYLWQDRLVEASKQFLSEALVDDLVSLGQKHAAIAAKPGPESYPGTAFPKEPGIFIQIVDKPELGKRFKVSSVKDLARVPLAQRHQVLHLLPTPGTWHLAYTLVALLFEQFDVQSIKPVQKIQQNWGEFVWDDQWVEFSQRFLSPALLDDLMVLLENHSGCFS